MQYMTHWSPGFSRWNACQDRASCRERLIRVMNVENIVRIRMTGSPGFSRWNACQDRADCRERPIRVMNGEQRAVGCIRCTVLLPYFISWLFFNVH